MLATLTGLGLSSAAGLNAYIPLLLVGLLARYTDAVTLPESFAWIANGWVLGIVAVLLAVEVAVDKVALIDSFNDALQTLIRPAVGGAIFAATAAAERVDSSAWMQEHAWVGWLLGIAVAALVHALKATARPVLNATTAGTAAPVVSAAEDATSLGLTLVAVFFPILVILVLGLLVWGAIALVRRRWRRRGQRTLR